jgi:hypothetical protein
MLHQYINLKFLSHLNAYDLINKFNYINYYIIPKYNKLTLKLFIKGSLTPNFLKLYLKNFLLLYLYCYNILNTKLKFKKIRKKKLKSYKVKLFLSYSFMQKSFLRSIFNFFFLFKKFLRPFYFSNHHFIFSSSSGKLLSSNSKIITFIPSLMLLDHKEHRMFPFFNKSKIFLTITLKNILTNSFYNFFLEQKKSTKNFLKNFLLVWYLI